jgi:adenylosuccinate lyase
MIERYRRSEMTRIWSDGSRFEKWLLVETLALEGMALEGLVPAEAAAALRRVSAVDPVRVAEIEDEVKHDVIAFLTAVAEQAGTEARFMHRGMTSNDLLDTAFALQLRESAVLILHGVDQVLDALTVAINAHRHSLCIGRSHGMHAEPTTFGIKMAGWFAELVRARFRFQRAADEVRVGKLSGAVGTYAALPPAVEAYVLGKLGLAPETVATQVVARDRHAAFFHAIAMIGTAIDRACTEIRHLQRNEVGEVQEPFGSGQKGSSAMPHKKNPILCENLCGLNRLLRSYADAALENVVLWHERDISHSSVERVIAPDACQLIDFMLHRFTRIIEGMEVRTDRMRENLNSGNGVVFSGAVLLALADSGVSRETAYRLVQSHAFEAAQGGRSLKERVLGDPEITARVPADRLAEVFREESYIRHSDLIIDRALAERATLASSL